MHESKMRIEYCPKQYLEFHSFCGKESSKVRGKAHTALKCLIQNATAMIQQGKVLTHCGKLPGYYESQKLLTKEINH